MKQLFILLIVFAYIGHIYPLDFYKGDSFVITYYNERSSKVKNLDASVYIPDLDIYEKSHSFYISGHDSARSIIDIYNDKDIEPGYYPVIITIENNKGVYEKRHTWVTFN